MYKTFEKILKEKGITRYRVSKETGVSQPILSRWKKGIATPKVGKIIKIAKYLNVPLEKLICEDDESEVI